MGQGRTTASEAAPQVETSERSNTGGAWRTYLPAFGFIGLLTTLQLMRQAGAPATDTIWAEDGRVFLTDALAENSPLLVFRPLAGYMHLVPRVLAGLAALLPLEAAAFVFAVGPALIVSLLALYSYNALRDVLPSPLARLAIATLVAVLPATVVESANNAANLHFYLVFGAFVALLHHPRSPGGIVAGSLFAFMAATSDPRTALLIPLAAWSLYRGPWNRKIVALTLLGGLLIQAGVLIASFGFGIDSTTRLAVPQFQESQPQHLAVLYGVRVVSHLLVGDRWIVAIWERLGIWLAVAGLVLLALVTVAIAVRRSTRWVGLVVLGYSVGYFAFQAMAWGTSGLWPYGGGSSGNSRYVVLPQLLLAIAVGLVIDRLAGEPARAWRVAMGGLVVAVFAVAALHMRIEIVRSAGPRWSSEVTRARARCAGTTQPVAIPISPPWGPEWAVQTDCTRIR